MIRMMFIALVAGAVAGCGGGGGGSSDSEPPTQDVVEEVSCKTPQEKYPDGGIEQFAGVYTGTMLLDGEARSAFMLAAPSGRIMASTTEPGFLLSGLTNDLERQDAPLKFWAGNQSMMELYSVQRDVNSFNTVSDDQVVSLVVDRITPDVNACMENTDISGTWTGQSPDFVSGGIITTTITIEPSGMFNGSDSNGCVLSGLLSDHGIVGGTFSVTGGALENCAQRGAFRGIGSVIASAPGEASQVVFVIEAESTQRSVTLTR